MKSEKLISIAQDLVESAEESDFFDSVYDTLSDWEFVEAEGDEKEGYIFFNKVVECGYTQNDIEITIDDQNDDQNVNIEEFAEVFKIDIDAKIHYYITIDGMMNFDTCGGGTDVDIIQSHIEDIEFDEEKYPHIAKIPNVYEQIEKELLLLPKANPQDLFDVNFDYLLVDTVKEYSNER